MGMEPAKSCLQIFTLWETNIAIENGYLIVDFPIKNGGSFHSYVSLPEGKLSKLSMIIIIVFF